MEKEFKFMLIHTGQVGLKFKIFINLLIYTYTLKILKLYMAATIFLSLLLELCILNHKRIVIAIR